MDRIIELPRADRWQSMARASIREDLYAAHAALTADVLLGGQRQLDARAALQGVGGEERGDPGPGATTLEEIRRADAFDLANLSVAMRVVRGLLSTT